MSGQTISRPRALGIVAVVAIVIATGQLANALFGNPFVGLTVAAIVGSIGFFAIRAGAGWLRAVGISLLILVTAATAYAAFVFWWNYG